MRSRKVRNVIVYVLLFIGATAVTAQSNERIDELLSQDQAQIGHAAYLVFSAAELLDEETDPDGAMRYGIENGLIPTGSNQDDPVTFGRFSYLMTASFGIPGGVMYRLFPGPRYAAREVVYQGWSRKRRASSEVIDGDTVVRVLSVYLNDQGGSR